MSRARVWRVGITAVVVTLAAYGVHARAEGRHTEPPAGTGAAGFRERDERDVQIRVWRQALDADSASAIALGQLAALHLQRAREGGTFDDYRQAETYARRSLAQRTHRNASTVATLVSILLAQHRFTDARAQAEHLVSLEPDVPAYRAALGEVAMEVGDDSLAARMFRSVWADRATLTIAARLARWMELTGNVPAARRLLHDASVEAMRRRDVPTETKAWFALRQGELELRAGRYRNAEALFESGLQSEPGDPRLFAAMARLASAQHRYRDAVTWGERSIGVQLDPATLSVIGDAYASMGDSAKAAEYLATMEVAVSLQAGAYHRAWSLHLLDHGLRVPDVLSQARAELAERKDVYGWDVYAWALFKAGRNAEARTAMQQALRLGTRDPLLQRHAAEIGVSESLVAAGA